VLENYFPILLFIFVGLAIGLGPIIIGSLVSPNKPSDAKKTHPTNAVLKLLKMHV